MQLRTALQQGLELLREGRVGAPELTAEVLLGHALRRERVYLYSHPEHELTELEWLHYGRYLHERLKGKPTQYITHVQEFWGREFRVGPGVLIPRPETEHVVEQAVAALRELTAEHKTQHRALTDQQTVHPQKSKIDRESPSTEPRTKRAAKARYQRSLTVTAPFRNVFRTAAIKARGYLSRVGGRSLRSRFGAEKAGGMGQVWDVGARSAGVLGKTPGVVGQPSVRGALQPAQTGDINRSLPVAAPFRVLDIGTGSGILAVTLALETGALTYATDLSPKALSIASGNGSKLGAACHFTQCDLGSAFADRSFDLIVSNPPYIESAEIAVLQSEVRDWEPREALDGGPSGLDIYARLIPEAARLLRPGGWLILEIGAGQGETVPALFDDSWRTPRVIDDLAGLPRVVEARVALA